MIARSSAYANTWNPLSFSSTSRSLNIIRNKVGDSTPPCITPYPSLISSNLVFILVYLYSHSIVLITSPLICSSRILRKRISWLTVSNADLRSMNNVHNPACYCFLNLYLIYSVILRRFTSHPIPLLNPVCPILSFHFYPICRSFYSSIFKMVSMSLYIGAVFVIGLAL